MFISNSNRSSEIDSKFLHSLKIIKEVIDTFQIETLRRELSIIERYASSNMHIDVVVLGQFKAGKSSLINSLIDENILPVGVIPVTSIITRLQYAAEKKAYVYFLDRTFKDINVNELEDYITETKNPKNIKQVEIVDLFLPQLNQFQNIRIIDTPGIGSFFKHNSDKTKQWLSEIGSALMAISVERPLSEDDILLLKSIQRYTAEIKIILTKSDLISLHQLNEIIEYIKNSLVNERLNDCLLLPYSTMKDAEENRNQLMEKIFVPLKENFSENFESIFRHKINSIIQSCLSYLKVGLESANKTEMEREILKDAIIDEHLKLQIIKNELDIICSSYKYKNREFVSSIVMSYSKEIRGKLENYFQNEFNSWEGNLYKLSRNFELWMQDKLNEILFGYSEKAILKLEDYVKDIQNHLNLFADSFAERLNQNVEKVLGVKLNIMALSLEIEKIKQPDISVSSSFNIHIDLLWFLFPMFLFKQLFKRFFQKKIPYEVEKNLNRLTSDIAENIGKIIERNRKLIMDYIYNELLTVENILSNQRKESDNFRFAIEKIEKLSDVPGD